MKSFEDIVLYKKMYYLANKNKLKNYSKNYYTYKKSAGNLTNEEINEEMKKFLSNYKNHNKTLLIKNKNKIRITNENITISFN